MQSKILQLEKPSQSSSSDVKVSEPKLSWRCIILNGCFFAESKFKLPNIPYDI